MNNAGLAKVGHAKAWRCSVRYGLVWRGEARCSTAWFLLLGCLSACTSVPIISPPQIVTVTHTVYQPIPTAYLTPCLIPVGTPATNGELLIHDQAAMADLMACNQQLQRIKTLAPPATTHQ